MLEDLSYGELFQQCRQYAKEKEKLQEELDSVQQTLTSSQKELAELKEQLASTQVELRKKSIHVIGYENIMYCLIDLTVCYNDGTPDNSGFLGVAKWLDHKQDCTGPWFEWAEAELLYARGMRMSQNAAGQATDTEQPQEQEGDTADPGVLEEDLRASEASDAANETEVKSLTEKLRASAIANAAQDKEISRLGADLQEAQREVEELSRQMTNKDKQFEALGDKHEEILSDARDVLANIPLHQANMKRLQSIASNSEYLNSATEALLNTELGKQARLKDVKAAVYHTLHNNSSPMNIDDIIAKVERLLATEVLPIPNTDGYDWFESVGHNVRRQFTDANRFDATTGEIVSGDSSRRIRTHQPPPVSRDNTSDT
ncbi:hypothetical protein EKO04_005392 [Ascochyta lentis]|uniref:Uncharacterized protein n=1 Tax=Ascochyta lentis TaxID=205686 RepID=A0A8H7MIN2_9PLEO|nr:hypothetical protein EKO04_005392 [Ascochyta lentis]